MTLAEGELLIVVVPTVLRPVSFGTLENLIRYAKRATFAHLEAKRHKRIPDQIDWRLVHENTHVSLPYLSSAAVSKG